jgi:hypothetical protein
MVVVGCYRALLGFNKTHHQFQAIVSIDVSGFWAFANPVASFITVN